ncbi:MAG: hypothetical protein JWP12_2946 [Bacteroidetes bacterium]|nr:hypothetical protein [Bacteroidota bacterium]
MALILIAFLLIGYKSTAAPADTMKLIRVQILHGSKPLALTEKKTIGGLWGGHVVIQMDSTVYGFSFSSKKIHAVVHHRKSAGIYEVETLNEWDQAHATGKITTIEIPLTPAQYNTLIQEYQTYAQQSPHDYAFFGMRCAASCYWLLGSIGIENECSRPKSIRKAFYPKALRLKLEKLAKEKNYKVTVQQGRKSRKWEGDEGF